MQGNMVGMSYPQGMNQQQGWMGGQMMGNYGYGNQNFPTAYPQPYGNQGYGMPVSSIINQFYAGFSCLFSKNCFEINGHHPLLYKLTLLDANGINF